LLPVPTFLTKGWYYRNMFREFTHKIRSFNPEAAIVRFILALTARNGIDL
jgi:hypothetical protein